jgi:two-component system alkaline phosphatase synthesis response regulator PhoP
MKKPKILLIDDEELVLAGLSEELMSAGFHVNTALNGKEAIKMVKEEKPDIIFTDLVMPGMNGVEVCKEIKEINSAIEVVLISGHPEEIEKYQMDFIVAGGRDEYLRKPLFENEVLQVTTKILENKI